jgi:hypothetical protein
MHPKSTKNWAHEKTLKITQNYLKSTLKNFQNSLFLDIPNGFLFLDQAIWRLKKNNTKTKQNKAES